VLSLPHLARNRQTLRGNGRESAPLMETAPIALSLMLKRATDAVAVSFLYSALVDRSVGVSGSASFQVVRKSSRLRGVSRSLACIGPRETELRQRTNTSELPSAMTESLATRGGLVRSPAAK